MVKHMIEKIVEELIKRGYSSEAITVYKNGVKKEGITIGNGNIRPTLYPGNLEGKSIDNVVNEIIETYENLEIPDIPANISSWEFAKDRCFLCIRPKTDEDILKRDFLDLEMYVRVRAFAMGSYIVKPGVFADVSEEEIFDRALVNTRKEESVEDLFKVLHQMGSYKKNDIEEIPTYLRQLVISNSEKSYGAAAICDKELLMKIAKEYDRNIVILPSSVHECILILENTPNMEELSNMVKEINYDIVDKEDLLSDHAYFFNRETNEITW